MFKRADPTRIAVIAMIATCVICLLAVAPHLLKSDQRVAATNSIAPASFVLDLERSQPEVCLTNQNVPRDAARVRWIIGTYDKPPVPATVTVKDRDGRVVSTTVTRAYSNDEPLTARIGTRPADLADATTCLSFKFDTTTARIAVAGEASDTIKPTQQVLVRGKPMQIEIALAYLYAEDRSIASMLGTMFDRAELFRPAWIESWAFPLVLGLALFGGLAVLFLLATARLDSVSVGRLVVVVGALMFVNALGWSVISPGFQPPDEAGHYWYVEHLAHKGSSAPPELDGNNTSVTKRTNRAISLDGRFIGQHPDAKPPWTEREEQIWRNDDEAFKKQPDIGQPLGSWMHYSSLYYWPGVIPYKAAGTADPFTKISLVRIYSALLATLTAVFVFLMAIELFPARKLPALVAGFAAAFLPMMGHIGGAINNDNMYVMWSALACFLLARAYRRNLGLTIAAAIGVVCGLAIIAKPTALGIVAAVLIGTLGLAWRHRSRNWRSAIPALTAVGGCLATIMLTTLILGGVEGSYSDVGAPKKNGGMSITDFLSYEWQWYLPRMHLPFLVNKFDTLPVVSVFFRGFVGDFNALDTHFPDWVYAIGMMVGLLLATALAAAGWRARDRRAEWLPTAVIAALAVIFTCLLINVISYSAFVSSGAIFAQGRYLLPLVPVFGLFVAAAAAAFGHRFERAVGVSVLVLLCLMNVAGMFLSLERFYL